MTADVYTGKHRREGALATLGAPGTLKTSGIPAQGKPAWSKAGRLLAAQIVVIAKEPYPGRVKTRLTPPFTPVQAAEPLVSRSADATFGLAEDGGFWLLGLREVDPGLILGVPMSQPDTGPRQLARLQQAGLRVTMLPQLTDVDTVREAEHVAALTPGSRFAACMARLREPADQAIAAAQ